MKKSIILVLLFLLVMPLAVLGASRTGLANFSDTQNHWAQADIATAAGLNIMNGTGTDSSGTKIFSPQGLVTRAQLAVVMQGTFQLDYGHKVFIKQPQATDYYADVTNDAWYSDALVMCEVNEIFPAGGNFSPDRPVTRIETAQAIYRSFNAKGISIPMIMMMPVFEDTEGLTQAETNAMVFVNNTGIMKGYDNRFRPNDNLTRGELAGVIARCVELVALDENYQGQTYQLKTGQSFIVGLTSNPSTGYEWQVKNSGDPGIIQLSGQAFREPPATVIPIVGQAGKEFFQFQGIGSGTAKIELVYSRPWESVQPAKIFSLKVEVS